MHISRFQTSGSDPGEDFCMLNSILRSKITNSFNQGRKIRIYNFKNICFNPITGLAIQVPAHFQFVA